MRRVAALRAFSNATTRAFVASFDGPHNNKNNRMPWSHDSTVQALRLTYNAAIAAHAACARVLTDASIRGEDPPQAAVEAEVAARARLADARSKLHAAMASFVGSGATDAAIEPANE